MKLCVICHRVCLILSQEILAASTQAEVKPLPLQTNAQIRSTIAESDAGLKELIASKTNTIFICNHFLVTDLSAFEFNDFGKAKIKNYKVSPDAFFQAALHIATKRTLYVDSHVAVLFSLELFSPELLNIRVY